MGRNMKKSKDMDVGGGQDKATCLILRGIFLLAMIVLVYDIIIGNNHIQFYWENKSILDIFSNNIKNLH